MKSKIIYFFLLSLLFACTNNKKDITKQRIDESLISYESKYWNKHSLAHVLLNRIVSNKTQVLWSTNNHTAAPVPIGSVGPEKYTRALHGIIQNDSIGRVLKDAVKNNINVILVIGDGMGNMQMALSVYERYASGRKEPTMFEKIMAEGDAGYVYTGTARGLVTGSAASATAFASGKKTLMNMVGVDSTGTPLKSVMSLAKDLGYKTALVSDAGITDATPAAFYAHIHNRDITDEIAVSLVESDVADVILGGGGNQFIPKNTNLKDFYANSQHADYKSSRDDTLNLIKQFENKGYSFCYDLESMNNANSNKLLGFFAGGGMMSYIDKRNNNKLPDLTQMADKALSLVDANKSKYFAMIECARIDWEAHDNDLVSVYQGVQEMNKVLKVAYSFYKKNPENTLLVYTADHETGGLEIAYLKKYDYPETKQMPNGNTWTNITMPLFYKDYIEILNKQNTTVSKIFSMSKTKQELHDNIKKHFGYDLSMEQIKMLEFARYDYQKYKQ